MMADTNEIQSQPGAPADPETGGETQSRGRGPRGGRADHRGDQRRREP